MTTINTFPLVWCENCGKATDPPKVADLALVGGAAPLACAECGGMLTLLECMIHPRSETWQEKPGASIRNIATLHALEGLPTHGQISTNGRRP